MNGYDDEDEVFTTDPDGELRSIGTSWNYKGVMQDCQCDLHVKSAF